MADMPATISRYFDAARRNDDETLAACFAENGLVEDEGERHVGRDAIRRDGGDRSPASTPTRSLLLVAKIWMGAPSASPPISRAISRAVKRTSISALRSAMV